MVINFDLAVKNGRVYTPQGLKAFDVWICGGKIAALGGSHKAEEEVDAGGSIVLPGAIDAHVHFRDPGKTYEEDWLSGSISAAAGGVTTVVDQPNTDPRTMDKSSFEVKLDEATHKSVVDFCINGGPGKVKELLGLGAAAIGEIFAYDYKDEDLQRILSEVERSGALPTVHAEDEEVIRKRSEPLRNQRDPDLWSRARPNPAEAVSIEKALLWTRKSHICHLSTRQGLALIKDAKASGKNVSCEVAPHHLLLNRSDYREQGTYLKMNPPLRSPEDNSALWAGLRDGSIDILASDHAPHLPEDKRLEVWDAPPGVPGVETMLPLMLVAVRSNLLSLDRLVDAISVKPAKILGLRSKGSLEVGKDADLIVVDPRSATTITADKLHSRSDWTPYEGRNGIFPRATLVRGAVVFDGELEVRPGYGRLQKPV